MHFDYTRTFSRPFNVQVTIFNSNNFISATAWRVMFWAVFVSRKSYGGFFMNYIFVVDRLGTREEVIKFWKWSETHSRYQSVVRAALLRLLGFTYRIRPLCMSATVLVQWSILTYFTYTYAPDRHHDIINTDIKKSLLLAPDRRSN